MNRTNYPFPSQSSIDTNCLHSFRFVLFCFVFDLLYESIVVKIREPRRTFNCFRLVISNFTEELGDYDEEIHVGDYVSSLKLALRQTDQLERKVMELHRKRDPGQDVQAAIDEFMSIARGLETYGVDPHPVKDHRGTQLYLGINYTGINTFASGKRVQHFRWSEVHKLNYEGKMFIAHLSYFDRESREVVSLTI